MKTFLTALFLLAVSVAGFTQSKLPPLDTSPLDVAYFPENYPLLRIQLKATDPLLARVIYSRPQKNNRTIFGGLIEYGKVWRLGANEASEVEFFQNVKIGNVKVKKGRYTLYAIPSASTWTMILNRENDIWGSYAYDPKKDVVRMDLPVQKQTDISEAFGIVLEKINGGFNLSALWDDVKVSLPVSLQPL